MEPEKDDGSDIMRKVIGIVSILAILLLLAAPGEVSAKQVEFNYQGRVKVNGKPFNGLGNFKFAIVDAPGSVSYWSNDGTSLSGSEPAAAVEIEVTDGVFNVIVGDDTITNMTKLPPSIFNTKNKKLHLRTWFSDGTHGYEQLQPDKQITNALLMGLVAPEGTDIYVDPATGDDDNSGLNPDHPKQTIQAAWDSLPGLLEENATIHLADGVYREQVYMTGKTVVNDATITITGNVSSPGSVRVTGADAGAETTPVRDDGFRIDRQRNLLIEGIHFDYVIWRAIYAIESSLYVRDCEMDNLGFFGAGYGGSSLWAEYSIVHCYRVICSNSNHGFYTRRHNTFFGYDCTITGMYGLGVESGEASYAYLENFQIDGAYGASGKTRWGLRTGNLGFLALYATPTTVQNCEIGLQASTGAVANVGEGTWVSYSGNDSNQYTERGGQIY